MTVGSGQSRNLIFPMSHKFSLLLRTRRSARPDNLVVDGVRDKVATVCLQRSNTTRQGMIPQLLQKSNSLEDKVVSQFEQISLRKVPLG